MIGIEWRRKKYPYSNSTFIHVDNKVWALVSKLTKNGENWKMHYTSHFLSTSAGWAEESYVGPLRNIFLPSPSVSLFQTKQAKFLVLNPCPYHFLFSLISFKPNRWLGLFMLLIWNLTIEKQDDLEIFDAPFYGDYRRYY